MSKRINFANVRELGRNHADAQVLYIYTIKSLPGQVKIGHTTRVDYRQRISEQLSASTPGTISVDIVYYTDDSAAFERTLHKQLADKLVEGTREWFAVTPTWLLNNIDRLKIAHDRYQEEIRLAQWQHECTVRQKNEAEAALRRMQKAEADAAEVRQRALAAYAKRKAEWEAAHPAYWERTTIYEYFGWQSVIILWFCILTPAMSILSSYDQKFFVDKPEYVMFVVLAAFVFVAYVIAKIMPFTRRHPAKPYPPYSN